MSGWGLSPPWLCRIFRLSLVNRYVNMQPMDWEIVYYSEAVREWVNDLPVGVRAYYARITERMVKLGPHLGMPYTRSMGDDLFEIRAKGPEGIARIFYCTVVAIRIVVLHGFIKKTDKTPRRELAVARRRLQEVKNEDA